MKYDIGSVVTLKNKPGEWLITYRMFSEYTVVPHERETIQEEEIDEVIRANRS